VAATEAADIMGTLDSHQIDPDIGEAGIQCGAGVAGEEPRPQTLVLAGLDPAEQC
jgi:hypothetical protein